MKTKSYINLFESQGVLSKREIESRHQIELESYTLKLQIEARVLGDICQTSIIPAVIRYQTELLDNVKGLQAVFGEKEAKVAGETQVLIIKEISKHLNIIKTKVDEMVDARKKANKIEDIEKKAFDYCNIVKPFMDEIKYSSDKLEQLVDNSYWPLPKLRELLLTK